MSLELSIIVPVYNVEKYLDECLNSIIKIDGVTKEIIIVNDGSTDKSEEIIESFLDKFPKDLVYIKQNNKGLSVARNTGLLHAKGDYVIFCDSDDFLDSDKLLDLFIKGKEDSLDVILGDFQYFKDQKHFVDKQMIARSLRLTEFKLTNGLKFWDECFDSKRDSIRVEVVTNIFKRKMLMESNIFFTKNLLHEDTLFMYNVMIYATKVKYFPVFFYSYRLRENSIMRSLTLKNYVSKFYIAMELNSLKHRNNISSYCWDSYILSLYFTSVFNCRIKNQYLFDEIKDNSKLTFKSVLKLKLISFLHFFSNEIQIKL